MFVIEPYNIYVSPIEFQPSIFVVEVPKSLSCEYHEQFIENSLRMALKENSQIANGPVESSLKRTENWVFSQNYGDANVINISR